MLTSTALTLGLAVAGGALCDYLGVPLGWMIGALMVTSLRAVAGCSHLFGSLGGRVGQVLIATSIGLMVSPMVLVELGAWFGWMVFAALSGLAVAWLMTPVFARLAGTDLSTAYFSLMPGGAAEMSFIGRDYGANQAAVSIVHASRVALTVLVVPLVLIAIYGGDPHPVPKVAKTSLDTVPLSMVLVPAILLSLAWHRIGWANPFFMGGLIVAGMASGFGWIEGAMPPLGLATAQVALGYGLGSRFERQTLQQTLFVWQVGVLFLAAAILAAALLALALAAWTDADPREMILGFGIGGMSELVLTAKILGVNVTLVSAFQIFRATSVNVLAPLLYRSTFARSGQ